MWFTAAAFLDATTVEREQTSQVAHTDHELELNSSARVCKCAGVHIATGSNLQGLPANGRSFVLGLRTRIWSDAPTPRPSELLSGSVCCWLARPLLSRYRHGSRKVVAAGFQNLTRELDQRASEIIGLYVHCSAARNSLRAGFGNMEFIVSRFGPRGW